MYFDEYIVVNLNWLIHAKSSILVVPIVQTLNDPMTAVPAPSDVLSDVLRALRATGTVYFCDQLIAPWSKTFSDPEAASFHQVRHGSCKVSMRDRSALLGPGDLVFLGPGIEHQLDSDVPGVKPESNSTLLLCGYCRFELGGTGLSASLFPDFALLRREQQNKRAWLTGLLDQLGNEHMSSAPGATLAVNRLTEVLVLELIRMNFGQDGQGALMQALADPPIAKALQALHANPEQAWTLEGLAKRSNMSRAGFAARFRERVGQPMFAYLTALRVEHACALLADSSLSLFQVANSVGYESDVAFVKMFKKQMGVTPTAWKKSSQLKKMPILDGAREIARN